MMLIPAISFFAALLDVRGPFDMATKPIFYIPIGVAMTLFALALGVVLLFQGTLSKLVRFLIAGVLILIAGLLMLWSLFILFI